MIVIMSKSEQDIQRILSTMGMVIDVNFNMKINKQKTKQWFAAKLPDETRIK